MVEVFAGSLFGRLREWMGLVNLCCALHDDESWGQAMMDHLSSLSLAALQQVLAPLAVPIDHVTYGDISTLIPVWLDAGLNGVFPLEVAAGMDVTALQARYGSELLMIDGIDKRALTRGPEAIRAELARRLPLVAQGGFIPAVDHSVPHDIAFDNYLYFEGLLQEECQRSAVRQSGPAAGAAPHHPDIDPGGFIRQFGHLLSWRVALGAGWQRR